jgi:hypothetical protein
MRLSIEVMADQDEEYQLLLNQLSEEITSEKVASSK